MKTSNKSGKRRFLGLADRDDQEWFWNEAAGAVASVHALDMSKYLDLEPGDDGGAAVAEPADLDDRMRAARRQRRIQAAHQHMIDHGVGAWVEVLKEGYARVDAIIEDGGEFEPLAPGEKYDPADPEIAVFGSIPMRQKRPARGSERRANGEREELTLSNGAVVVRGGHVLGTEDASGEVPGLARLAHQVARRNLEESLELACRAYEEARAATDPLYEINRPKTEDEVGVGSLEMTQAQAARQLDVSRARVNQLIADGELRAVDRGKALVVIDVPDDLRDTDSESKN